MHGVGHARGSQTVPVSLRPAGLGGAAFQLVRRGVAENPCKTFLSAASLDHQVSSRRSCRSIGRSLLAAPYLKLRPNNPLATFAAVTFLPYRDQPWTAYRDRHVGRELASAPLLVLDA